MSLKYGRPSVHLASTVSWCMRRRRRCAARNMAIVWSATSSMKTSGTLVTTMPASVAASTSTVSAPTLPRPMTLQFFRPLMTAAVMRRFRAITRVGVLRRGDELLFRLRGHLDDLGADGVQRLALDRVGAVGEVIGDSPRRLLDDDLELSLCGWHEYNPLFGVVA